MKFKGRYIVLGVGFLMIVGGLVWRVVNLQVFDQSFLRNQGEIRTVRMVGTPAHRGIIRDRNGEPLAISTSVQAVWLNPKEFDPAHPQLLALAAMLDISVDQLIDKATRSADREFVYLQRQMTPELAYQIQSLEIPGIRLKSESRRYYPAGEVSAHVVGITNLDDRGKEGLELALDDHLRGAAGSKRVIRDRRGRQVQIVEGLKELQSGQDVILSLDQRLQYLAYRELKAVVASSQATAGSAIVLDVSTGEVLAMVNQPSFNPNTSIQLKTDGSYRNRAVTDVFEPGSVMKTFSVVNALQNGEVTPETLIDTSPGRMMIGKHPVSEDKGKDYGLINVATILQKSSNIGITKLTLALAPEKLVDTYARVGFGSSTNSGFPGERGGKLVQPPKQGSFVLATMAFGYGLNVTPLQLAQAYAILGAGGVKRPVTFLRQSDIATGEQVIDPVVAQQVVAMLSGVVEQGGGTKAKVPGYHTAGKTGTVRKLDSDGKYSKTNHVAVFAGLAPASNPRFAIVVMVDDPKLDLYYGSQLAAPLFSKIAAGALRLFNVPPDMFDHQGIRMAQAMENATRHE